ncbi:hypothetical protein ACLOJK_018703, partial [Asimina triloba]
MAHHQDADFLNSQARNPSNQRKWASKASKRQRASNKLHVQCSKTSNRFFKENEGIHVMGVNANKFMASNGQQQSRDVAMAAGECIQSVKSNLAIKGEQMEVEKNTTQQSEHPPLALGQMGESKHNKADGR